MSKHTPGPWAYSRWDQFGDARFYIAQKDGAPYTPHFSDVATLIAETCSGELVQIQEANARLISAAPDLLEALQAAKNSLVAFKFLPGHGNAWEDSDEENLQAVDAAIAKATGEQQ